MIKINDDDIRILNGIRTDVATLKQRVFGVDPAKGRPRYYPQAKDGSFSQIEAVLVKVTAAASGGGKYSGIILYGTSDSDSSTDLTMPEGMLTSGAINCQVINLNENGTTGNSLETNTYHVGLIVGGESSTGYPIVAIIGSSGSYGWVSVTSDGGAGGSDGVYPTWTYSFTAPDGSSQTAKSPQNRDIAVECTAATSAFVIKYSGTWYIIYANEKKVVNACTTTPSFGF